MNLFQIDQIAWFLKPSKLIKLILLFPDHITQFYLKNKLKYLFKIHLIFI